MKTASGRIRFVCSLLLVFTGAIAFPAPRQSQQQPEERGLRYGTVAETVIVDLVVRDRSGRPVLDLRADEIEVLEDGVPQEILSFDRIEKGRLVLTADAPEPGEPEPGADPKEMALPPQLVTFVFERLSNQGRQLSRQAALEFLKNESGANYLAAVFVLDQRLALVQPFTSEVDLVSEAIERALSGAFSQFVSESDQLQRELELAIRTQDSADALAGGLGPGSSPQAGMGAGFAEARLAAMQARMLQYSEALQREHQGQSSLYSLLSLVREQQQWAGRKTLIYFTEGLHVPPNLIELFRTTVSTANRSNVSVYAVDARGLTTARQGEAGRALLEQAASTSRARQLAGDGRAVSREEVMVGESAEASIRMNVQENLNHLAQGTGGFLIANTNDMRPGLRRLGEDLVSYYELSYVPKSQVYDGRFREITIRVNRPNVLVQSRSGYFAVPPSDGPPTLPYEIPMLNALSADPPPQDFIHRARAFRFGGEEFGLKFTLAMEVALENFTIQEEIARGLYKTRFSLMTLVRDDHGEIIHKFSEDYPLEGPLERLEAIRNGNVIFIRNLELESGRYRLETVAYDHETGRSSVRRSILVVPPIGDDLRLSSVCVIKRADPVTDPESDETNPLQYENLKLLPALDEAISRAQFPELSFFFVVYPQLEAAARPELLLELLADGQLLGRGDLELPEPDERGEIPYIASVPIAELEPGRYEVRVIVRQGDLTAKEHAFFSLEP
jgi:VWFA-related protein